MNDLFNLFESEIPEQSFNPKCRGCKQPYKDHIDLDGKKICPWPADYPKPDHTRQAPE